MQTKKGPAWGVQRKNTGHCEQAKDVSLSSMEEPSTSLTQRTLRSAAAREPTPILVTEKQAMKERKAPARWKAPPRTASSPISRDKKKAKR
jgi:hypothetical protein